MVCDADVTAGDPCCHANHGAHIFEVFKLVCELKFDLVGYLVPLLNYLEELQGVSTELLLVETGAIFGRNRGDCRVMIVLRLKVFASLPCSLHSPREAPLDNVFQLFHLCVVDESLRLDLSFLVECVTDICAFVVEALNDHIFDFFFEDCECLTDPQFCIFRRVEEGVGVGTARLRIHLLLRYDFQVIHLSFKSITTNLKSLK